MAHNCKSTETGYAADTKFHHLIFYFEFFDYMGRLIPDF